MSINIINDISPYLPDIFLKNNIFSSSDETDYNTVVLANTTIFIFNIYPSDIGSTLQYDDPNYLLYGVYPENTEDLYFFPSLCFFIPMIDNINYIVLEDILITSGNEDDVSDILLNLIKSIGYDPNLINFNYFRYRKLKCFDRTCSPSIVLYFYFYLKDPETTINYNYFNSTVYYDQNYWNILIYPYTYSSGLDFVENKNRNTNITYISSNYLSQSTNNLNPLSFNNTDLIKYIEKIDYKYMENTTNLFNKNNKMNLVKNYSINIKNFNEFFNSINKSTIFINNNEINKLYFENLDYENKHLNTYTLTKLNNNYINNNISYSNNDKKYSFTMNNKLSNIKNNNNKYSCYDFDIINIPSIYQITKNYNINSYVDITKENLNLNNELLFVTNTNLYKLLLSIDPYIINITYILKKYVYATVSDLSQNNNKLVFGSDTNKVNLFFSNKLINTDTYYINKYKITYFTTLSNGVKVSYLLLLSIVFYNGNNINITDLDITANTSQLGFITYTNQDCSVTLSPTIFFNNFINNNIINKKALQFALYDVKKYYYNIDYSSISNMVNTFNYYYSNHFYFFISNFSPNIVTYTDDEYKAPNNKLNIVLSKVNNLVTNIVNINRNISNFKFNIRDSKTLLMMSIVLDSNINPGYIYNYSYFPNILPEKSLPNTINTYKMNNYRELDKNNNTIYSTNLVEIPAGNYKVLQYNNLFNNYNLKESNAINDHIVKSINTYDNFFSNNFCLMIKLPDNINVDDEFYNDNYNNDYYSDNYSSNIGYYKTSIYMVAVAAPILNGIYVSTENIVYGLELFGTYNDITDTDTGNKYKIKMNVLINNYMNFNQLNFYAEIYDTYNEQNNLILDIDKLYQNLYPTTYLKDVVYYDFLRFQSNYDYNIITTQYNNFDITISNKLYWNKYYLYQLQINKNRAIFIFNTIKNLLSLYKSLTYLKQIKNNYMLGKNDNTYLIDLVRYNISLCLFINYNNYELNITYSTNNYIIQNLFNDLSTININTSLETINTYIKNIEYIINYFKLKINYVKTEFNKTFETINTFDYLKYGINFNDIINISTELNILISKITTNFDIFVLIYDEINNFTFNNNIINLKNNNIIINSIINYILIILLNSNKIEELYNLLNIIYYNQKFDIINYYSYETIIKNNYIYNTTYYNKNMNIQNFNYFDFLSDLKTTINYYANPSNINKGDFVYTGQDIFIYNDPDYNDVATIYKKCINDGVIKFIDNVILFFQLINEQIIGIYKFIHNINIGSLPKIDIYDNENISNLYYLLTEFKNNVDNMYNIIISNNINIFEDFVPAVDFLNSYYYSINEYLLYIQLYNDINNINTSSTVIFQDVLNILTIDEVYAEIKMFIEIIQNLYRFSNLQTINIYLKKLDINIEITDVTLHDVTVFDDFNIVQIDSYPIFNFNKQLLLIIQQMNTLTSSVFNYYYNTPDIDFYKQYINYNYITSPLLYVDIQNTI
jgi:hypothetical protein